MGMTPMQERFAMEVASGKSQADSYRIAYPKSQKWNEKTVWARASELWHDKQPGMVGRFDSFDQAKAAAERMEQEGLA